MSIAENYPRLRMAFVSLALCVACLLLAPTIQAEQVTARVDRDTVYQGDVLTLTISLDGAQAVEPDFSPLHKDFEILGQRSSTQVQLINGRSSIQRLWELELSAKRSGELQIPPLSVGDVHTQALNLTVTDTPPVANTDTDLVVEVSVDTGNSDPYVQAQVLYTVRLRYGIPLLEGVLTDPEPEGAMVQRLGDDRTYRTTVDGRQFAVVERQYAIFPEFSGELQIPPVYFRGRAATDKGGRSQRGTAFDSLFDRGRPVSAISEPVNLRVLAQPADFHGHWLPARQLWLRDIWHNQPSQARVGEPLQLSLLLEAEGLSAAHLPELELPEIPGVQIYPEPPQTQDQLNGQWLRGRQARTFTLMPTVAGEVQIPAMNIPWWDVSSGEQRVAQIPAQTLAVAASAATPQNSLPLADSGDDAATAQTSLGAADLLDATPSWIASLREQTPGWFYGLSAITLLMLLLGGLRRRHRPSSVRLANAPRWQLRAYCKQGLARPASHALLAWSALRWPAQPPRNLGELASRLEASQARQVHQLELALYAAGDASWEGKSLWRVLRWGLREPQRAISSGGYRLPPLYPRHASP